MLIYTNLVLSENKTAKGIDLISIDYNKLK